MRLPRRRSWRSRRWLGYLSRGGGGPERFRRDSGQGGAHSRGPTSRGPTSRGGDLARAHFAWGGGPGRLRPGRLRPGRLRPGRWGGYGSPHPFQQ